MIARPSASSSDQRRIALIDTPIAGLQYYDGRRSAVLQALRVGDELILRREPTNPHDELAIEVFTLTGLKLGYVPRVSNEVPARVADQGIELGVVIYEIDLNAE